jgi:DNA-binding IclR family transcriptional regulator
LQLANSFVNNKIPSYHCQMGETKQRGVGTVEVTMQILEAMLSSNAAQPLKDIAQRSGISAARIHPYMVSLIKSGLVEQVPGSAHYDLGPLALRLGVASLQRLDPVRIAVPFAQALASKIAHTVALAVWSNSQALIVHIEEALTPIRVTLRHGSVMSLSQTATGLLFAAHLERDELAKVLKLEQKESRLTERLPLGFLDRPRLTHSALTARLREIKAAGIATVADTALQGLGALSVPVFDHTGKMVLAITSIGLSATLNTQPDALPALELLKAARSISARLGVNAPASLSS